MAWRRAVLSSPGHLSLIEQDPPVPAPGELVVRVEVALTCGTDVKTWRRGHPKIPLPSPLGHEFTGRVLGAGAGAAFREGDPVVVAPSAPCGACAACRNGDESLCDRIDGTTMAWGAFADWIRIPAPIARRNTFLRPAGLSAERAALLEPLACVVNGVDRLDLTRVETAVVLGAGPIGLLFVALLRRRGVPRVGVVGRHRLRLDAARALGAHVVVDLDAHAGDTVAAMRAVAPAGPCAVVECVGRPEAWRDAIAGVRKGGEVLFYGGCASGTTVPLDAGRMHYDGLTLKGAFHFSPGDARRALDLLAGGLDLSCLISGSVPLEGVEEALGRMARGEVIKLAVLPGGGA